MGIHLTRPESWFIYNDIIITINFPAVEIVYLKDKKQSFSFQKNLKVNLKPRK